MSCIQAKIVDLCVQDFPAKYIYEPWKAPIADQKAANCRLGVEYPRPICDHAQVSKENVAKLRQAYANQPQHNKSPAKGSAPANQEQTAAGQSQTGPGQSQSAAVGSSANHAGQSQAPIPHNVADSNQDSSSQHQSPAAKRSGKSSKLNSKGTAAQQSHPPSGFEDVAVPSDPQEADSHQTDTAEPDASMPGGCASGKARAPLSADDNDASVGPKGAEVPEALAKQKKLDWTAVAAVGEKRKRNDVAEKSPPGKRRSPRQKKLSFAGQS